MSFNPNANANSFTPGAGANTPPFRPGQPYQNPYSQQPPQPQQSQQQYDQYYQQNSGYGQLHLQFLHLSISKLMNLNIGGYQPPQQGYGGYPQQQYQQYDQQGYNPYAAQPEQQVYNPPAKVLPPVSTIPFSRAQVDPNAPPPVKAPTMSFKIGGAAAEKVPAVSLKIGGGGKPVSVPAKAPSPKVTTPIPSKPSTPAPIEKKSSAAVKETKATVAAKQDATKTTDGDTLKKEVEAAADEETLKDLYGGDEECGYFLTDLENWKLMRLNSNCWS